MPARAYCRAASGRAPLSDEEEEVVALVEVEVEGMGGAAAGRPGQAWPGHKGDVQGDKQRRIYLRAHAGGLRDGRQPGWLAHTERSDLKKRNAQIGPSRRRHLARRLTHHFAHHLARSRRHRAGRRHLTRAVGLPPLPEPQLLRVNKLLRY